MDNANLGMETPPEDYELAVFRYLDWKPMYKVVRPYEVVFEIDPQGGTPRCIFGFVSSTTPEKVSNIRGHEREYSLDKHGFEARQHRTQFAKWFDREALRTQYIPEMEHWLLS